ncbi:MAG TPA: polysaccharide deacetylase, partial [Sorangium sp.]|nr:polysaccharide deacetylase [Sorangium sp.]
MHQWYSVAMGIRNKVAFALDRLGVLPLALRAPPMTKVLTVLTYHRVATLPADYLFDAGVVDATVTQFEAHLAFVKRHYNVIALDQLRRFTHGQPLPPRALLITFDDGYRDNHDVVLPLLLRFGLTAVFFVATRYIDERRLYWWDTINYLVRSSNVTTLSVNYPTTLHFKLPAQRGLALRTFVTLMKEMRGLDSDRFLAQLATALKVPWSRD